jgi:hypothetical protein
MKKFMLLFERINEPDTETQQKRGGEWVFSLQKEILGDCCPFDPDGKVISKGTVSDYKTSGLDFGGYMIVKGNSLDEAVEIAKGAPHVEMGGKIIVRPVTAI